MLTQRSQLLRHNLNSCFCKGTISPEAEHQANTSTADESPEDVEAEINYQLKLMERLDEIEANKPKNSSKK